MVVSHEGGVRAGKGEVVDKFHGEVGDGSFWLGRTRRRRIVNWALGCECLGRYGMDAHLEMEEWKTNVVQRKENHRDANPWWGVPGLVQWIRPWSHARPRSPGRAGRVPARPMSLRLASLFEPHSFAVRPSFSEGCSSDQVRSLQIPNKPPQRDQGFFEARQGIPHFRVLPSSLCRRLLFANSLQLNHSPDLGPRRHNTQAIARRALPVWMDAP